VTIPNVLPAKIILIMMELIAIVVQLAVILVLMENVTAIVVTIY
jgi:hypothetical protein